jgi:hypothetical protein
MGERARTVDMAEYLRLLEDKRLMPALVSKTEAAKVFRIVNRSGMFEACVCLVCIVYTLSWDGVSFTCH